ncbi:hypothetical protein [Streptomyces sp. NPDC059957]|uniref:hypothetical protein n=1 Tax=unclassified Streptomyces TaxID=2593676 RepID=UPI00364B3B2E
MLDTVLTGGDTPARLIALPGVYRPQSDTRLPADALSREEPGSGTEVLEIGTGALALCAAGAGARVTAVDVSWPAVFATRLNALRRRLPLRVFHGDFAARTRGLTADVCPGSRSPGARCCGPDGRGC